MSTEPTSELSAALNALKELQRKFEFMVKEQSRLINNAQVTFNCYQRAATEAELAYDKLEAQLKRECTLPDAAQSIVPK